VPEVREAGHADEGEPDRVELGTGQVVLDVHPRDLERAVGIAREQRTAARGAGPGQHPRVRPAAVGSGRSGGLGAPGERAEEGGAVAPGGTISGTVWSSVSSLTAASAPRRSATRARQSFFCQFANTTWRTRKIALASHGSHGAGVTPARARSVGSGRSRPRAALIPAA
jgi:hypothetical protein